LSNKFRKLKSLLRNILPYCLVTHLQQRRSDLRFEFGYSKWEEVVARSSGYSKSNILDTVEKSVREMIASGRGWERDGVLFSAIRLSHPVLSSLLLAIKPDQTLDVVDFGGGLGTTYFQNIDVLSKNDVRVKWTILEQDNFVAVGSELFKSNFSLNFVEFNDSFTQANPDILLFGSVLCYLENPYEILVEAIKRCNFPDFVVIDRTLFVEESENVYGVQIVSSNIYRASLPLHLLTFKEIENSVSPWYTFEYDWQDQDQLSLTFEVKGMMFRKNRGANAKAD
jgi:putative methyltransferase (TIGR04325 family)